MALVFLGVRLFSISITVAISLTIAIILAIFAITVIITVLSFLQIQTMITVHRLGNLSFSASSLIKVYSFL